MEDVIKVDKLCKSYGALQAVDHVSLRVKRGEVFGLLGSNGAGKSSAMECILGTKKADSGTVSILGLDPITDRKRLFEKVGVQFQETNFQDSITVWELCNVTASLYREALYPGDLLKKFDLVEKKNALVKDLSGGQKQRLFIILALIPNPDIVFLDELTTGLDVANRREVWKILSEMKTNGLTVVLTSHFMDEVEALCDEICILNHGKMEFYGPVAEAIEKSPCDNLEDAYLWYTGKGGKYNENV